MLLFSSCTNQTDYEKVKSFFYSKGKSGFDEFEYIVIINEEGTCLNCNKIFAEAMSNNIQDHDVLFILSGNGTKIDISPFTESRDENIIMDYDKEFNKLGLVNQCALFKIDNQRIVKKIEIGKENVMNFTSPYQLE